jgi:plasmid stability protein
MTIRNIDDQPKSKLPVCAAEHGRTMDEEERDILRSELATAHKPSANLAEAIRKRIAPFGGVVLEIPPREPIREVVLI